MPGVFVGTIDLVDVDQISLGGTNIVQVYVGPTLIWPPGVGGFTPLDFPELTSWATAKDLTGQTDGTDVTVWEDKSGNNFDWVQRAAETLPTKETRNTFPALQFVTTNSQIMENGTASRQDLIGVDANGLSVIVAELASDPPIGSGNYFESWATFSDGWWHMGARDVSGNQWEGALWDVSPTSLLISATIQERAIIMLRKINDNEVFFSVNGGTEVEATTLLSTTSEIPTIGGYSTTAYLDGWIYELVTSTSNGTVQERTDLIDYLKSEWGIT